MIIILIMYILFKNFNNVSKARGVRCECILSGLLAVTSHLAAHSTIQISGNYKLVPTMLWCISGLIGTNKGGLISLIQPRLFYANGSTI